jgi:hypothetical protein
MLLRTAALVRFATTGWWKSARRYRNFRRAIFDSRRLHDQKAKKLRRKAVKSAARSAKTPKNAEKSGGEEGVEASKKICAEEGFEKARQKDGIMA